MEKDSKDSEKKKTLPIVEVQQALIDWYDLRFNEITGVVEGRKKDEDEFKVLNENNIYIQLLSNGYRVSFSNLCALLNSEYVKPYNPFRDYFESLPPWTTEDSDYIEELANHVVAVDQAQFNHHFKKMMVRTIACAIDDHVFNKHAFILVGGEQNTGKSTFCRYLVPNALNDYFTESIPNDKDGLISLCENFIINLDELSTLSRFELNHLKSLFSKDRVRVRHPFARKSQTDPRRVSFVGSTNEDTFLTDTTGSVRWLCFEIVKIIWKYKTVPVDKCWSQAYALYKSGFEFHLTPEELQENSARNQQFQQIPMEYEYIQKYVAQGNEMDDDKFQTPTEIREYILSRSDIKADIKSTEKLGKTLIQLGFKRVSKRIEGSPYPLWGYIVKYLE
ncbi:MAG TPA: VapE family protein [Bacteroidales bacterium]|nr:VapE family protein [Bacteroidales bacterium]